MKGLRKIRRTALDSLCGHRVVFHHVPKCGGTSIERSLRIRYGISYATFPLRSQYNAIEALRPDFGIEDIDLHSAWIREVQFLDYLYQDIRCIAGHIYFSSSAYKIFSDKYYFVTTLRDPVDFFVSFYLQMFHSDEKRWKIDYALESFLDTPLAELFGTFYALYFSELPQNQLVSNNQAAQLSINNLRKFTLVGFLEDMSKFKRRLSEILGVRLWVGHANKSNAKQDDKDDIITPSIRRKIEALSAVNFEIYETAKLNFST